MNAFGDFKTECLDAGHATRRTGKGADLKAGGKLVRQAPQSSHDLGADSGRSPEILQPEQMRAVGQHLAQFPIRRSLHDGEETGNRRPGAVGRYRRAGISTRGPRAEFPSIISQMADRRRGRSGPCRKPVGLAPSYLNQSRRRPSSGPSRVEGIKGVPPSSRLTLDSGGGGTAPPLGIFPDVHNIKSRARPAGLQTRSTFRS